MTSWHSYPQIFALGHRYITDLLLDPVLVEEKVDGCVVPEAKILTTALHYVEAGSLRVGEELIGFTDTTNNPTLERSTVTAAIPIRKACSYLVFHDGREITASNDHPWLVRGKSNNLKQWKLTSDLELDDELVGLPLWQHESSWKSGYIAGMYDGEGSLVRHGNGRTLSFYQKTGPELDVVAEILQQRVFHVSVDVRQRNPLHKPSGSIILRGGGWPEIMRFLGIFRPQRLLAKAEEKVWSGSPTNGLLRPRLIHKEGVGTRTVIGLSTSTNTYIAEGMLCHNSQFSFGKFVDEAGNEFIRCRSKGAEINVLAPERMFKNGVEYVQSIQHKLTVGWTYRGEYLCKPKHNALIYDRVPKNNIILFDINTAEEAYVSYEQLEIKARALDLEVVPRMYEGMVTDIHYFRSLLDTTSILGGQKVEGVVIKNYARFGQDKKVLLGKFVSEAFKEVHNREWKAANPTQNDVIFKLIESLKTPARWNKAIQHMRETGKLDDSPKDIGLLMKEIPQDVEKEEVEYIKQKLYEWAWPHIRRGVIAGLPEYYKEELMKRQFSESTL